MPTNNFPALGHTCEARFGAMAFVLKFDRI